ncbi:ABC transporter permease [Raoultibacter phocaeensis]|uniref:ABC transporter permease n=1 Tax=Raoultibacter phocaeensis TaxID=2479841 RepID=UPI001117E662|nr:ABC transporter permease subunit [Raoultibacter phocaeensis]
MSVCGRKIKSALAPYALIAPTVVLVLVFLYGVVNGVLQGFGIMPFLGKTEFTAQYYLEALGRPDFTASLGFSLYVSAVSSALAVVGGIALSAALVRLSSSRALQVLGVSIPLMTAHTLVVLFVVSLFAGTGLVPRVLYALGLIEGIGGFPSVVGDPSGWGIVLVYLWKEIPFVAFCTITIMANVSDRFGEAARTLGASAIRSFFTITLPLCKGALAKAFLIVFAFSFGAYEVPFLLGPTLPKAIPVLAYLEFQNPDILNRSYAMAINGIMVLVCTVLAIAYFVVLQRERKR